MKQLLLIFFLALGLLSFGQQDRFLFIQAPKDQPFYVRLGEKTYSSSAFGHLVIPSLKDNSYQLFIGFPRNSLPEQEFPVQISGKDRGLDLRVEKGTQVFLYDWQSMQLIRSNTPQVAKTEISVTGTKRTDPFARLMAGVVNDSLVLYTDKPVSRDAVVMVPAKKMDSVSRSAQPRQDTVLVAKNEKKDTLVERPNKDTVAVAAVESIGSGDSVSVIAKADSSAGRTADTVAVASNEPPSVKESTPAVIILSEETTPEQKRITYQVNDTKEKIEIVIPKDIEPLAPDVPAAPAVSSVKDTVYAKDSSTAIVLMNSDCTKFAVDTDVDKLRVQMLKESSDDDKVFAARKIFRTKCFSTKQIIALTELFGTDEGRYMFFDAAYPFVSDSGNFKSLVRFLSNEYYINRFKALVRM